MADNNSPDEKNESLKYINQSLGLAGIVEGEIVYDTIFSLKHMGKVSDIISAYMEQRGVESIRSRAFVFFSILVAHLNYSTNDFVKSIEIEYGGTEKLSAIAIRYRGNSVGSDLEKEISENSELKDTLDVLKKNTSRLIIKSTKSGSRVEFLGVWDLASDYTKYTDFSFETINDKLDASVVAEEKVKDLANIPKMLNVSELKLNDLLQSDDYASSVVKQATALALESFQTTVGGMSEELAKLLLKGKLDKDLIQKIKSKAGIEDAKNLIEGFDENLVNQTTVLSSKKRPTLTEEEKLLFGTNGDEDSDEVRVFGSSNSNVPPPPPMKFKNKKINAENKTTVTSSGIDLDSEIIVGENEPSETNFEGVSSASAPPVFSPKLPVFEFKNISKSEIVKTLDLKVENIFDEIIKNSTASGDVNDQEIQKIIIKALGIIKDDFVKENVLDEAEVKFLIKTLEDNIKTAAKQLRIGLEQLHEGSILNQKNDYEKKIKRLEAIVSLYDDEKDKINKEHKRIVAELEKKIKNLNENAPAFRSSESTKKSVHVSEHVAGKEMESSLERALADKKEIVQLKDKEIQKLQTQISELQAKLDNIDKAAIEEERASNKEHEELEGVVDNLQRTIENEKGISARLKTHLNDAFKRTTAERAALRDQKSKLLKQVKAKELEFLSNSNKLQDEIRRQAEDLKQLSNQDRRNKETIKKLNEQIESFAAAGEIEDIPALKRKQAQAERVIERYQKETIELRKKFEDLRSQTQKDKNTSQGSQYEYTMLLAKLEGANKQNDALKKQITDLADKYSKLVTKGTQSNTDSTSANARGASGGERAGEAAATKLKLEQTQRMFLTMKDELTKSHKKLEALRKDEADMRKEVVRLSQDLLQYQKKFGPLTGVKKAG